uniref:Zinc finger, CCHC-type n=1 Tax=Tanacetum cinerariifolium TaxID=118510 RepID=A0A699GSS2_TANCI|nr:zinc finger, CCHC-type [Tanacetum cinerariifolium]
MGDENHIRTLGYYSIPSHKGHRNTIELPNGNNVVPLRSNTIRLVQNECSFHELRSEDPNQHLKNFIKLVDSLDLDVANKERTRLRVFQFFLRDQARNWLKRFPARSISSWEDLTTRFLDQFFPPGRTSKLQNDILMFQQYLGESLSEAWIRSRTYSKKSLIMASIFGSKSKSFMTMSTLLQGEPSINRLVGAWDTKEVAEVDEESEEPYEEVKEEEDDLEYFDTFLIIKEIGYHKWVLKNPRPSWVNAKVLSTCRGKKGRIHEDLKLK